LPGVQRVTPRSARAASTDSRPPPLISSETEAASKARPNQQTEQQCQAAEELGAAGQQGHQVTRREADRGHELARAFEAVAAEGAEQLLRTVRHEDDADGDAQGQRGPAGVGGQQALQGAGKRDRVHGVFLSKGCVSMARLYELQSER
jgi:hypothetical protein